MVVVSYSIILIVLYAKGTVCTQGPAQVQTEMLDGEGDESEYQTGTEKLLHCQLLPPCLVAQ